MHESAPSVTPIANTVIDLLRKIAFLACAKDRREDVSAAFDKKILAPAIEAFRAGQARRDEIREASGCAALRREEAETVDRLIDVENRIAKTPAVSLAGLVAQIEYFRDSIDPLVGWDVIIQGLRTVVQPRCIGFGEPEANG
ncbi:MAG: hypothetical protein ACJ8AH_18990 [Stellaceae bacterium]|jgi:hypothetical protein